MVKVAQMTLPPGYQSLLDKILSHFNLMIYPTWATRNFHLTRAAKAANKEKSYIPGARVVWASFDAPTKALWKSDAAFMEYTGYQYFIAKHSYARKNGLDPNVTPTLLHQMHAFFATNPGGFEEVQWVRDDIVLTGPISVQFMYKQVEYTPAYGDGFTLHIDAYYFDGGENKIDTYDFVAPAGSHDWTSASFSFGQAGRFYFHVVCTWSLDYYDADVFFDNLLIKDQAGDVYREAFWVKAGKSWVYTPHYRKQGWKFYPDFTTLWFDVVYSD